MSKVKASRVFAFDGSSYIESYRNENVIVSIPDSLRDDVSFSECDSVGTGLFLVGINRGRRWGVVKMYSKWVDQEGSCRGFHYLAFDLQDKYEAENFDRLAKTAE